MGGAADLPQRSSSPLKRRASDLEADTTSSQKDDVDMIAVPSDAEDTTETTAQSSRSKRAQSIDMLKDEQEGYALRSKAPVASAKEAKDLPPIDAQIKIVTALLEASREHQLQDGDKVYLISKTWLNRVTSRGSEARQNSKVEPEGEVGPVDNSDIIQQIIKDAEGVEFVQLKHGIGMESFETFPEDAWEVVMNWYGLMAGSIPIIRYAHNTNVDKTGIPNVIYELHPPIFTIHRLWSDSSNLIPQLQKAKNPDAPVFVVSRSTPYVDFIKRIKSKAGIDLKKKVQVWRVPRLQPAAETGEPSVNMTTPPSSRPNSPAPGVTITQAPREPQDSWTALLLDVTTFLDLPKGDKRELIDIPDPSANANFNGHTDLAFYGLGDNQAIVLDEHVEGKIWVTTHNSKTQKSGGSTLRTNASNLSTSQPNSGRTSPSPYMTRGRAKTSGKTQGTVGLSNLGNTCYMNSALQCVRSVPELTKYFLTGVANTELNYENPLGNRGEVAKAYRDLLVEMYKEPPPTSVAPRHFKNTIGKYAPSFSGYAQQDSQEFLGFLLDGLQEDLSRIKKKPYIEKPDSTDEMVNNPEAIREMASKVWDITKKRDDSVIADLFTGMYKSTLVCPVCDKVSITFDPFNNVTLQLPIENTWTHPIYYFPLNDKPMIISVDMDKQGSILAMKQYMSEKVGVPVERLFVAEEFKHRIYKIHDDNEQASEAIGNNDNIAMYELESKPTNWPSPRKPEKKKKSMLNFNSYGNDSDEEDVPNWQDPLAERMLVPVFYRRPNVDRGRSYRKPWSLAAVPHFIMLTPEEARSEDLIRRKILEKVATLTDHSMFFEEEETDTSTTDDVDPDLVIANGSDSSGEGKIVAHSIDGDDSIVDVTMKEPSEATVDEASEPEPIKPSKPVFNKRRPKFMESGSFLEPDMQNLFDLGYFQGTKEMVPTGWQQVDDDKTYPTLASRNPQIQQTTEEDFEMENGQNSSESGNEDNPFNRGDQEAFSATTRMNDESSEDELSHPPARVLPVRSAHKVGETGRARRIKTYSRKGNKPARKSPALSNLDQDAPDEGPLIRLGEGIVVDWHEEAFVALFEGDKGDTFRGRSTLNEIPTFKDTELDAKRIARTKRRKNGITLDDCLNEFGKEEILSEQDTWYCPRCKEHRRATKKFELWKTPDILVMHLKRFSSNSYRRDKLDILVDFPIEGLDLSSRVLEKEDGKTEIYDLFAVDDHWGGLGGGHYTAFAKSFIDDAWYEYNDSSVSKPKDLSQVVTSSAYLLFYRRRSEVPLGGPRFQQIYNDFDNNPESSEDDIAESGEDQGLVANSSHHGSSSALTGVGAAHRPANLGSNSAGQMTTVNPRDLDGLPPYQPHDDSLDGMPLLANENDGQPMPSIENGMEDEGIDMGFNNIPYNPLTRNSLHSSNAIRETWSFAAINNQSHKFISGTGSEIDGNDSGAALDLDGSDVVQDASSASASSRRGRLEDFDNTIPMNDDGEEYVEDNPVPDMDTENQLDTLELHRELMQGGAMLRPEFKVSVEEHDEIEEPATEIHVEEGEGIKLD